VTSDETSRIAGFVLCGFAVVALNACANSTATAPTSEAPTVITLESGKKICAVHHIPLVTVRAYRMKGWMEETRFEDYYRKLEAENPNRFPSPVFSRTRDKEHTIPDEVSYCPSCQAAMDGLSVYYGDERIFS
jgi:hypothetical protein